MVEDEQENEEKDVEQRDEQRQDPDLLTVRRSLRNKPTSASVVFCRDFVWNFIAGSCRLTGGDGVRLQPSRKLLGLMTPTTAQRMTCSDCCC